MLEIRKSFFKLLGKDKELIIKRDKLTNDEVDSKTTETDEEKSSVPRFLYNRFERVKINEDFKYSHYDLTGNAQIDFNKLFGIHDHHGSLRILEHPFRENYLRIKRSHDVMLSFHNDVYQIYNGRHRIVYLKAFHEMRRGLDWSNGYYIPASVTHYIDDVSVNKIIDSLIKDYKAEIHKGNYYDDWISFFIVINGRLYIVKSSEELEDFYKNIDNLDNEYLLSTVTDNSAIEVGEIFQAIFASIGKALFEMSFTSLFEFLKNEGVTLNGRRFSLEEMDYKAIYNYHFNICRSYQTCIVYGYDIPDSLEITKVKSNPINTCGYTIMEFLYDNPYYQEIPWEELYEVIRMFTGFEKYDSDFLLKSAMKAGYIKREFVKGREKNKVTRW